MRIRVRAKAGGTAVLMALLSTSARARSQEEDQPAWQTARPERRSGLVVGVGAGFALAGASGYPNKASQIDDPAYYAASGLGAGWGQTVYVMGALADYVNFGAWFGGASAQNADWKTSVRGGGLRVDVFPLYVLVPTLRDLGVAAQMGIGATSIEAVRGAYPGAKGVQSYIGLGAFYEWTIWRLGKGHLVAGPSLDYTAALSRSVSHHSVSAGARLVFYTAR